MCRFTTSALAAVLGVALISGSALGADRKQDRKRDGSCVAPATATTSGDQTRTTQRDRKRDGSCQATTVTRGDRVVKQDRKRDGSCKPLTTTATPKRDRKRDGSCK